MNLLCTAKISICDALPTLNICCWSLPCSPVVNSWKYMILYIWILHRIIPESPRYFVFYVEASLKSLKYLSNRQLLQSALQSTNSNTALNFTALVSPAYFLLILNSDWKWLYLCSDPFWWKLSNEVEWIYVCLDFFSFFFTFGETTRPSSYPAFRRACCVCKFMSSIRDRNERRLTIT